MKTLNRTKTLLDCGRILFAWFVGLFAICFISTISLHYAALFALAGGTVILYSLSPKVLCRSSFSKRLAFGFYCVAVISFIIVSLWLVSKLGNGPILVKGTYVLGNSRTWGIVIAFFMSLCALSGPIGLLFYRKEA